jgi:predicted dehydrogenase
MNKQTNRRDFVFASAGAVAAMPLQAQSAQEVRAGFVGVGVRGGSLFKQTLEQQNVRVAAVCDIDAQTRDRALSQASRDNPRSLTEWRRMLDMKDVEAVFIATPCDLHAEMAAAFLEAGKYVYLEKPLAITPEGVALVLRAARRSKGFLQIGQQLRYFPNMREGIRQIHGGLIGRTYIMKAHRHGSRSRPRPGGPAPTPQQKTRTDWYADVKRSGDLIVENAVHNIDACNWIANSRPVSAYGHGKKHFPEPMPPGKLMMDGYSVKYIYENDVHCDYSQIGFHPRHLKVLPSGMWYTVFGEKGSVYMTHSSAMFFDLYGEQEPVDMLAGTKGAGGRENAVADFYACIREKRQPFADIRVAATAALTAIMGRESIYKGRSVTWKEMGVEL